MATHHAEEIPPGVTRVLAMKQGRIAAQGPKAEILTGPVLSELFGLPVEVDLRHDRFWPRVASAS